jgi:hypothetical protein
MPTKKSRLGLLIAAGIVVVVAGGGIAFVVMKSQHASTPATQASGTEPVASGSDKTVERGSGIQVAAASGSQVAAVATGSGSAQTQAGSAKVEPSPAPSPEPPAKTTAKLVFETTPNGAEILINGIVVEDGDKPVLTPEPIQVTISSKPIKITLRKAGYDDYEIKNVATAEDLTKTGIKLKPKRTSTGRGSAGRGSSRPTNDTGLMTPD